jgi:uncharacterized cupin superfamily protein
MTSHILNIEDIEYHDWGHGDKYQARIAWVGTTMASSKLGFNVTEIPPGKRAFPCHSHAANEELFFILAGQGEIRIGDDKHDIRQGDFISFPPGRATPHQIINNSAAALRFIAISTMIVPEVTEYPDSGKYGVFAGSPTARQVTEDTIRKIYPMDGDVSYWEGED